MNKIDLEEFDQDLAQFDWTYEMSDDGRWYRAGMEQRRKLYAKTIDNISATKLFRAWEDYGNPFGHRDRVKLDVVRKEVLDGGLE